MKRILAIIIFMLCVFTLAIPSFASTADKTELNILLHENYNPSLYTAESYLAYQSTVTEALAVYENDLATQDEVNRIATDLKAAKEGLEQILNREPLLSYADSIEEFLFETNYKFSAEVAATLTAARDEFLALYEDPALTNDQLAAASVKFSSVIEVAETAEEISKFSSKDPGEGVIVPEKVISSTQGLGRVTAIRLTLLGIGLGLIVIGIIVTALYMKPKKS